MPRRRKRPDKDFKPDNEKKAPRLATQGRKKRCESNLLKPIQIYA